MITLTIPNDDHIALRAFGKALEEMALAHGAEPHNTTVGELSYKLNIDTSEATAALERLNAATGELMQAAPHMLDELRFEGDEIQGKRKEPEIDTTAQQVESLAVPMADNESDEEQAPSTTDSTGTPWDERIHSASKALNADGTWRLRRKPKDMDEAEWAAFVESVKAELTYREQMKEETEQSFDIEQQPVNLDHVSMNDIPEPPVTPPGDDFHTDAGVVTEQTVAGIPPIPVPPPVTEWQSEVTHPETGDLCSVCMKPQFSSPSGVTCENGHGGAPAYEKPVPPPVVTDWTFPKLMTFLTERHGKIDVPTVNQLLAIDGLAALTDLNAHPDKISPFVARVKAHLGE